MNKHRNEYNPTISPAHANAITHHNTAAKGVASSSKNIGNHVTFLKNYVTVRHIPELILKSQFLSRPLLFLKEKSTPENPLLKIFS